MNRDNFSTIELVEIADVLNMNLKSKTQKRYGKSERTVEVYSNSAKEFFKWFYDSYGNVEFKKLYRENILEYKSYLKNVKKYSHSGNNLCPKSINSKLSALICFNELMEPDNIERKQGW
jgi:integrase/recombinase XerD